MKHSFKSNSSSIRELESRRRVTWKGAVLTLQPRDALLLRSVDAKCRQGFTCPLLLRFPFSRVTVKHPSLRWLPVPGRLVCKLYEIPPPAPATNTTTNTTTTSLWATRNDARKTEKETGRRRRSRVRDKMQSCKCHVQTQTPVSQCYFHPPLFKPVNCCMSASVFCHLLYKDSHSGDKEEKNPNKTTKKSPPPHAQKKGLASLVNTFLFVSLRWFLLLCYASRTPGVVSFLWFITVSHFFIHAQNCKLILMKLLYRCTLHRAFWYIKKKGTRQKKKTNMTTISTNPMTAEPRRKINNGKEEHVRRNLDKRYIHGCAPALLTNIHILRVKGERKTSLDSLADPWSCFILAVTRSVCNASW